MLSENVTEGLFILGNSTSFSSLPSRYDGFLFAPICEDTNGMRLSVLSALARMNVDPWEEATRLAAMPKASAQRALVAMLDLVGDISGKLPDVATIAARLVELLPQREDGATAAATDLAASGAQRTQRMSYWLLWLGLAIAMSLLSQQHQVTPTDAGLSQSQSGTTSQISPPQSDSADSGHPATGDQAP